MPRSVLRRRARRQRLRDKYGRQGPSLRALPWEAVTRHGIFFSCAGRECEVRKRKLTSRAQTMDGRRRNDHVASSYPSPGRSVFYQTEGGRKKTVPHLHEQDLGRTIRGTGEGSIATPTSDFFSLAPVLPWCTCVGCVSASARQSRPLVSWERVSSASVHNKILFASARQSRAQCC